MGPFWKNGKWPNVVEAGSVVRGRIHAVHKPRYSVPEKGSIVLHLSDESDEFKKKIGKQKVIKMQFIDMKWN